MAEGRSRPAAAPGKEDRRFAGRLGLETPDLADAAARISLPLTPSQPIVR